MAKIVALDAGHGMHTAGKQTPDGIKEWTLNDKVRDKIVKLLSDYDVKLIFPDNNEGETDEGLTSRRNMYLNAKADAAVSIHHNAYKGTWGDATGVGVYIDRNHTSSDYELAKCIYGRLPKYTGLRGRGINKANFTVIYQNSIPAVLVEGGFMDGREDYKVITSDEGQTAYAKAVAEGLIEFLDLKKKTSSTTSVSDISESNEKPTVVKATAYATHRDNSVAGTYKTTYALHIRNDAGITNKSLGVIPKGASCQCFGYYSVSDGVRWLYVKVTFNGITYYGFCSSNYLER